MSLLLLKNSNKKGEKYLSYSSELKQQIVISEIKSKCCAGAELAALILMNSDGNFVSKDKNFIRRINALASKAKHLDIKKRVYKGKDKKGADYWGIEIFVGEGFDLNQVYNNFCCSNAFFRGCFLYSGYVADPEKSSRAELSFKNSIPADFCKKHMHRCGISYNITNKNDKEVLYIKSVSSVSDFLAHIGAVGAMLEFENRNIIKKANSDANRMMNCDNANLDKSVAAAAKQTEMLKEFMKTAKFDTLPEQLKEIAELRVNNDSLSLKELGMLVTPVLSKSGVAHRLKKIEDIIKKVN